MRGHEPMAQRVLTDHACPHELLQIIGAARLHARPRHAHATEWLRTNGCTGDLTVDVEVAHPEAPPGQLDVLGQTREHPAGQREVAVERHLECAAEVVRAEDAKHRSENFLAREAVVRLDAGEDSWCDVEALAGHFASIGKMS